MCDGSYFECPEHGTAMLLGICMDCRDEEE